MSPHPSFETQFNKRVALVAIAFVASLSLVAVASLLATIIFNLIRKPRRPSPVAIFFIMTLFYDIFMATGSVLDARWAGLGRVDEDKYCIAQGSLKQFGELGVATSTLLLTWAMLFLLVFREPDTEMPRWVNIVSWTLAVLDIIMIVLVVTLPLAFHGKRYWGNTGMWCWISDDFPAERLWLEYYWLWTAGASAILAYLAAFAHAYGLLYGSANSTGLYLGFRLRPHGNGLEFALFRKMGPGETVGGFRLWTQRLESGMMVVIGAIGINRDPVHKVEDSKLDEEGKAASVMKRNKTKQQARMLLLFPAAYVIVIAPQSVIRMRQFKGHIPSTAVTVTGSCIFALSGLFNTLLYMTGRFHFDLGKTPETTVRTSFSDEEIAGKKLDGDGDGDGDSQGKENGVSSPGENGKGGVGHIEDNRRSEVQSGYFSEVGETVRSSVGPSEMDGVPELTKH
jgi:hypothetical protein